METKTMDSKTETMLVLNIDEKELTEDKARVIQKCFCAAALKQESTIANKLLSDFITIRDTLYPKPKFKKFDYQAEEIKLILKEIHHKEFNILTISMLDEVHKILDEAQKKILAIAQDMSGVKDD